MAPSGRYDHRDAKGHDAEELSPQGNATPMPRRMSTIVEVAPQLIASATLHVDTPGAGFTDITENAVSFVTQAGAGEGVLLIYLRHTSASLTIQENADPDVQADLVAALD